MDSEKIKVLEVNIDDQGNGGVYSLIKSVIENKPDNISIDIAALEPFDKKSNIKYLNNLGTHVYYVGYNGNKLKKQIIIYQNMIKLLKKKKYDVVHIHSDVANKLLVSGMAAKKCGVKRIILHSHATDVDGDKRELKMKMHYLCRNRLKAIGAQYAACSYAAAKWMFPGIKKEDVIIIKNGIDVSKYGFDKDVRKKERDALGLKKNDFLIGHVGRFMYQKNHSYILEVFGDLLKKWEKADKKGTPRLLLIGDGHLMPEIKEQAVQMGINDKIIFYGLSDKVCDLLQAMDAFIMPSNFEGFGIAALEAQASGLNIICSDKVPKAVRQIKNVFFLPITKEATGKWSDLLINFDYGKRTDNSEYLKKRGYDIESTVKHLVDIYANGAKALGQKKDKKLTDAEVKDELFKILSDFADYCDENGLKYSLCGGTLLGAVRHKDFIPWDDDVDVFLSRPDYERLHELIKEKPIASNYRLESLQNGKLSLPFAKIVNTETRIDEKYFVHDRHLWIDIFPVDGMPSSKKESDRLIDEIMRLKRYAGWALARPGTGSTKLRTVARNVAMIIPKLRGAAYYSQMITDLAQINDFEKCDYVGSSVWAVSRGERIPKTQYENITEVDFHGRKFHAPEYEDYLSGLYGDYMKLPPEKDRKSHSITVYMKRKWRNS